MNDNKNLNDSTVNAYKASSNLNTAIENPNIDVDSITSVNIQNNQINDGSPSNNYGSFNDSAVNNNVASSNNLGNNGIVNDNISGNNNTLISNEVSSSMVDYNQNSDTYVNSYSNADDGNVNYEPVYEKKEEKNNNNKIIISRELKLLVFIVFILLLFILLLPSLFNIFNKIVLLITRG